MNGHGFVDLRGSIASSLLVLSLLCSGTASGALLPDLIIRLQGPNEITVGADTGPLKLTIGNAGQRIAHGTDSAQKKGYMIDLFLTRSTIPTGFALFSDNYFDGVLLRGGRISNTRDISQDSKRNYSATVGIPVDVPAGKYRLCAKVDAGNVIVESNEKNNLSCIPVRVRSPLPQITGIEPIELLQPTQPTVPHLTPVPEPSPAPPVAGMVGVRRSVLADGTMQLEFPDGTIRRMRPDGSVVTIKPDGSVMIPQALQVQDAELPSLPPEFEGWGNQINERLLGILRGILSAPEFEAYLQTEQDKSFYEKIDWRIRSISFLATEQ